MQDHYKTLGVRANADDTAIRAAYRRLVRETHPDMSDDPVDHARFAYIADAYRVLADPIKRRRHDAFRVLMFAKPIRRIAQSLTDPQTRTRLGSMILSLLRRLTHAPDTQPDRDGDNIDLVREISFPDSFTGLSLRVDYERRLRCRTCEGTGRESYEPCPLCHGNTEIKLADGTVRKVCPRCAGEGIVGHGHCRTCAGQGRITKNETLTLRVPPGVENGTRLRAKGKGHEGRPGGGDGDLFVELRAAGSLRFSRQGLDLIADKVIPLCTALKGGRVAVGLPDDSAIEVDVPPGVFPGAKLTVADRGFHSPPARSKGNLVLHLDVYLPDDFDDQGRATAYRWFDAVRDGDGDAAAQLADHLSELSEGLPCGDEFSA